MARIIIGVNGDGYGHATRTRPLVEHLQKKHKIKLLAGGKAYPYLKRYYKGVVKIPALNLVYENNKVNIGRTTVHNIIFVLKKSEDFRKIKSSIKRYNPDIIISDFELFTLYSSILLQIPCIMTDNQHIMIKTWLNLPIKYWDDYINAMIAVRFVSLHAKYYCIPTFFYPPVKNKRKVFLIPPIIRDEIKKLKPKKGNHILVYQTSTTYKDLFPILKRIKHKFIVYGFDEDKKGENLILRKFNEKVFFKDLADCKAVIMNGGFSLISEALYLGKPILSVPIKKTLEQILNAIYLQKLGYGEYHEFLTKKKVEHFLSNLKIYADNINREYKRDPEAGIKKIEFLIDSIVNKKD